MLSNAGMRTLPVLVLLACAPAAVVAKVPAEEAARLGKELTPLGGEQVGNAAQTIPAWTGGLTSPPAFDPAKTLPDPFADDQPLATLTGQNFGEHAAHLTPGQQALFKQYPQTYSIKLYPTRRSAVFPQWLYDETIKNATRVELVNNGASFSGAVRGFPFPLPQNGREALWNHMARYVTKGLKGCSSKAITTESGDHVIERGCFEMSFHYNHPDATLENFKNRYAYILSKTVSPPSKAGDAVLLQVPFDRQKEETLLYSYNAGQRKMRRIGEVGYAHPLNDGLLTHDQVDMFNGPMDRYQFELKGKQEIYVPYNTYRLHSASTKYADMIRRGHINNDLVRWELHRVWVIEATLVPGVNHIYSKRVFYVDEDSWLILLQDIYDTRGEFWRTAVTHAITYYNVPVVANPLQVHYDLQSRRYVLIGLTNEERERVIYDWYQKPEYFTQSELKRFVDR